jgi:two-component system response regulator (stage 0 sporulation protein A)
MNISELDIINILNKLGISPNKDGYRFLIEGIKMCYEDNNLLYSITTKLYPLLSKKFAKKVSSIERSIRYAIEVGWLNSDYNYSNELFENILSYNKLNPSNSLFIATIVEYLKRNCK